MIAYLSPHEAFQLHTVHRQTRARAAGILLAAAGHGVLLLWLLGQTFRQPDLVDNTPDQPPMVVQNVDLTPPRPSPTPPTPTPASNVHAAPTPLTKQVDTLPVKLVSVKTTGQVSVNPFVNPAGVGGTLTLGTPSIAHTLTNPDWISRPTADQVEKVYPEAALREGITGSATLSCQVTSAGGVVGCKVNVETPAGRGFGRAALGLTPFFRIRPGTDNGQPIQGASVLIPIRFAISG
jgi:protein TonB